MDICRSSPAATPTASPDKAEKKPVEFIVSKENLIVIQFLYNRLELFSHGVKEAHDMWKNQISPDEKFSKSGFI